MCTAIYHKTAETTACLARTMDFSYPLHPELFLIPRGHRWKNQLGTHWITDRFSILGIGQDLSPVVLADGMNEAGFGAAALYFPGFAMYDPLPEPPSLSLTLSALEIVHFLLGQCDSVSDAAYLLPTLKITGLKDPVTESIAPLHWILSDNSGACLTVEKTSAGLSLLHNPAGILSNSPDFSWHMANLRNYVNLSDRQTESAAWSDLSLTPFGQGGGSFGLPGDYTPPSRFVRAAFLKTHALFPPDPEGSVLACFHILENVSIPKGIVKTTRGTWDYTQYTAVLELTDQVYYFRTYDNPQIAQARLRPGYDYGTEILSFGKLNRPPAFGQWSLSPDLSSF